jgi:hypothetical protein
MSSFTPGPWNIFKGIWELEIEADGIAICDLCQRGDEEQELANARLIAAAPDLLEALEFMLSVFNETYPDVADDEEDREAWAKARAAIKKATGEE